MSFLCDFCSRSVGSRCNHNLEGVRVGDPCGRFAPTLQSVFGARGLHDELASGRDHILGELREAARFNGFPREETRRVLALADEVPPPEFAPPPFPQGAPVFTFDSALERDRAVRCLEEQGVTGFRSERGLAVVLADTPTAASAAGALVECVVRGFHVARDGTGDGRGQPGEET